MVGKMNHGENGVWKCSWNTYALLSPQPLISALHNPIPMCSYDDVECDTDSDCECTCSVIILPINICGLLTKSVMDNRYLSHP